MKLATTCAALALTLGLTAASNAAIITVASVTSTGSSTQTGDAGTALINLINGSGLTGGTHSDALTGSWVTTDSSGAGGGADFFEAGGIGATNTVQLDFDLGGSFNLTSTDIWGYSFFGTTNTATAITVSYSTDGTNFSGAENITLPQTSVAAVQAVQSNALTGLAGTTHVRFLFTDNNGGNRVGLGEVQFDGVAASAVPEPSSTALLGLGGLALILRRRK